MTKDEKLCFQYGRESSETGSRNDLMADNRMKRMIRNSQTKKGCIRNMRNIAAWYLGKLFQDLTDGQVLDQERFRRSLIILLPEAKESAAAAWACFAREQSRENDPSVWYDAILAGFIRAANRYGVDIAAQICNMGLEHHFLHPDEIEYAAKDIKQGGGLETQRFLAEPPDIQPSPRLLDVLDDYSIRQEMPMGMTFY